MNVLVCGVPRSGTSWIAEILGETKRATLVNEPDHPLTNPAGGIAVRSLGLYPVLEPGERSEPYELIWDVTFAGGFPVNPATHHIRRWLDVLPVSARDRLMSGVARVWRRVRSPTEHVVAKTVAGLFALDWIADRYDARVVLTQRKLLSVIGSWMRLGFVPYGVESPVVLPEHPVVRREYIDRLGLEAVPADAPMLEQITFHVGLLAAQLDRMRVRHPDWLVTSHEDFCAAPETSFRALCDQLGLEWSDRAAATLSASDAPGEGTTTKRVASQQRDSWRRDLDPEKLRRVSAVLGQFGDEFPSINEALASCAAVCPP